MPGQQVALIQRPVWGLCPSLAGRKRPSIPVWAAASGKAVASPWHHPPGWRGQLAVEGPLEKGALLNTAPPCGPWALLGPSCHLLCCNLRGWGSGRVLGERRERSPQAVSTASPGQHATTVQASGHPSRMEFGLFSAPHCHRSLLMWVQAVTPAWGFPFKRKNEGTWEGPIVPRSRARSGNLEAAVTVQLEGKEGSFLFF